MHAPDDIGVTLPPQAVANAGFPYDAKLADARSFLASRGITSVRPVYGRTSSNTAARNATAEDRARARWFPEARVA